MKVVHLIIIYIALLTLAGCGENKSVRQLPHLGNTPYQQDTILVTYATNPERALTLLDSALLLGNMSEYRGQCIRARIYSKSLVEQRQDSAILICKELLGHDSVRNDAAEQENILDLLIAASRAKPDYEQYMHWATQKAELCQKQGQETERWRTEADIGLVMTHLGQVDEGLAKLDEAISRLDAPGSIDRMDAFIVACKRKINALEELHRYNEVITLGQRILDRLDHYEQHAKDYAEDSYRLSWSDHPNDRDRYLDFSRAQAWGFMAQSYANLSVECRTESVEFATAVPDTLDSRAVANSKLYTLNSQKAREYLALFDQSSYGKTFAARRMIAPTQMALGMYDEALATYDEIARRMAADTLNDDYAVILRSRAIAAYAKAQSAAARSSSARLLSEGRKNSSLFTLHSSLQEAYGLMTRYADLSKAVSDSLHRSEAHDYAARYHAYEQQLEIQEKQAVAERSYIVSLAVALIALLAIAFAIYFFRQKRIVTEKNRALVRMINGTPPEPDEEPEPAEQETVPSSLFNDIDTAIRTERLYADIGLQRQDICNRFGIRRHTLNSLLSTYAGGRSFTQYINDIRIEEAVRLLRECPQMTITAIAAEAGFTASNLREKFKGLYGMTPGEYRQNL